MPPETSAQGGSSWIGSAVTGWFSTPDKNNGDSGGNSDDNVSGDDEKQDTFRKRKLALDDEQLEEKSSMFGWIGGELTNALGYGEKQAEKDSDSIPKADGERQPGEEKPAEEQEPPSGQSSSWLNIGFEDVLKFGGGETAETDKGIELSQGLDSGISPEGEESVSKHAPDSIKEIKETHTTETATDSVITEGNVGSLENPQESPGAIEKEAITEQTDENAEADSYGSMYNSIAGYTEETKEEHSEDGMPLSKIEESEHVATVEKTHIKDKAESLFPSDSLSSALGNASSQSKADIVNDRDEIQSRESEESKEHLVIGDFSSEGQKMSLDNDGDRKYLIENVSDTDNQKSLSEESDVLFLPEDSPTEYSKDRGNAEAPTIIETESEEEADPSVLYENKDETSEVLLTEKEPQTSDEKSSSDIADLSGQPHVSADPMDDSRMSEGTTEKISHIPEQSDLVSAETNTKEATSNQYGSTQFKENTGTLSEKFLADKASFEMDNTSDTEVTTLDQANVDSKEVSEPEDEKDIIDRNTQKFSDDITSFDESSLNNGKESITDNQHTDSDKPEQSQESELPEDSTEVLKMPQSIEREDSQSSDKDGENEQGETLSSDFSSKLHMTTDNQLKPNDYNLEARSDELTRDLTSSDLTKEKEDNEAQEKFNLIDDADSSVADKRKDAQQEVANESLTDSNTEGIHLEPDSLPRQSDEDVGNQNSSAEESLERVDSISSESIIDDPDSVILNDKETETDFSQRKIAEMFKEDETESETVDASGNSDTPTQNLEHQSELYMEQEKERSETSEDNTLYPIETLSGDTHIAVDLTLNSYMSETANITPSTNYKTTPITEEQQKQKSDIGVTASGQMEIQEKHKDSETDQDNPTTLMNGHLDSVKLGKDENDVHPPHGQSAEHVLIDDLIREDEKKTGWYNNIYDGFAGLYGGSSQPDDTGDAVNPSDTAETRKPEGFPNDEGKMGTQESQSLFSVGGLSSVFESFTSKPETDTSDQMKDQHNEDPSSEKSNTGKAISTQHAYLDLCL